MEPPPASHRSRWMCSHTVLWRLKNLSRNLGKEIWETSILFVDYKNVFMALGQH